MDLIHTPAGWVYPDPGPCPCGATGAGKTTFLRCLARSVGARERVVTIEEVFELDPSLPSRSVQIRTGEHELLIDAAGWIGRRAELDAHVRAWMLEHIDLHPARPRTASRRYDEQRMSAWRTVNPGRQ